ncbi:MAG: 1-phosphofructokinase family hexose kinase [Anaerolineae bacterium]|nr:1-phosphofructokinase family hexose kinase [Anaerolineae bacterium]
MIVTVSANTSIDHILFVPEFKLDATIRATRLSISVGGKAIDASWILGEMGLPSLSLGFAAGYEGQVCRQLLEAKGVTTDYVEVEGSSRRNIVIMSEAEGEQTSVTYSTLIVKPEHVPMLRERYIKALDESPEVVVLGGTLPSGMEPSFYEDFIGLAKARHIPVIFDGSEPFLSAGLKGHPDYVKPNQDEISQFAGRRIHTVDEAYAVGREIYERYGTCPIITLGSEGGLAVLPDRAYRVPPIRLEKVLNVAGAGDAVLAGLAASIARGEPIEEGIRLGFAAATAVVLMPGTAECRKEDIDRFLQEVELIPYQPA